MIIFEPNLHDTDYKNELEFVFLYYPERIQY